MKSRILKRIHRPQGVTLVELLIIIAVIALLTALLFPVFARAREKARVTACASNLRQLGVALQIYQDDHDGGFPLNGWGGGVYGYVKSTQVYACPADPTTDGTYHNAPLFVNSYAANVNLLYTHRAVDVFAPARTVQLFEVSQCRAKLTDALEDIRGDISHPPSISCMGNGTDVGLITIGPVKGDQEPPPPNYATGLLDNYHSASLSALSPFVSPVGRHNEGAEYLAVDGHIKWLRGTQVSAGENALAPGDDQSSTGCPANKGEGSLTEPCASGTANGKHTLTFSIH